MARTYRSDSSGLLADIYPDSVHVRDLDLIEADDLTIWRYAAEHDHRPAAEEAPRHDAGFNEDPDAALLALA